MTGHRVGSGDQQPAAARGAAAASRVVQLRERRAALSRGVPVTVENAEQARHNAEEALTRAQRAHHDAARRHLDAQQTHQRAAAAHEEAALHAGDAQIDHHLEAAERHRDAAAQHEAAARVQFDCEVEAATRSLPSAVVRR